MNAIATAPGVVRLAFGSVDFQLDLGIEGDRDELLMARSQLVLASRLAGLLPPVDGVTMTLDDTEALARDVTYARRLGFGGKLAVHPRQVAAINDGFSPSPADVEWARRVVAAASEAGDNALRLDGKLVDRPVIERARALLRNGSKQSALIARGQGARQDADGMHGLACSLRAVGDLVPAAGAVGNDQRAGIGLADRGQQ